MLRTVPVPVETILVACGRNIPSLETEGSVDAMKHFVNHETSIALLRNPAVSVSYDAKQ